ncbi:alpha/beta hydrolase [Streptomyces sp. NBC_01007]|nr:alpha/beta hydrolase [Streptomyces sp. NBC_01007]
MSVFAAPDGTRLAHHARGEGAPLLCLPGGPMRASAYLGDLGGLTRHRRLCVLDLRGTGDSGLPVDPATYRCDRQVDDVEAFRAHLGLDRVDLLAHSAAGDLALLYAVRHPRRVRTLTLVTGRARALGVDFTAEHRAEGAARRAAEPWFEGARDAYGRIWAGTATDADADAATPFFYGRWDAAARAHAATEVEQTNEEAADRYAAPGAFRPAAARAVVAAWEVRVLLVAGGLDSGPLPRVAAAVADLFPRAELAVLPDTGHFPWLDAPEAFRETVAGFLDRADREADQEADREVDRKVDRRDDPDDDRLSGREDDRRVGW